MGEQKPEVNKFHARFFHIFKAAILDGFLQLISGNELKTYCAIKCFVDHNTGVSKVSVNKIAKLTALSTRSIYRHVEALENLGHLKRKHIGAHKCNEYQIVEVFKKRDYTHSWSYVPAECVYLKQNLQNLEFDLERKPSRLLPAETAANISVDEAIKLAANLGNEGKVLLKNMSASSADNSVT